MKIVICTPTVSRPHPEYLASMEASVKLIQAMGYPEPQAVFEVGCPYISHARATLLRKALDSQAEAILFLDHDLSWQPEDLLRLIQAQGQVIAGTYRYKKDEVQYMGALWEKPDLFPEVREDGCVKAHSVPAGFLKVTRDAVKRFMRAYPALVFGDALNPSVDIFNHGAIDGCWFGEDMAFSRRWNAIGGELWIVPDVSVSHWEGDKEYPGNFHEFLMRQPGGSKHEEIIVADCALESVAQGANS